MKTLTLIRHAKSDWGHEGLMDIDRPLNQRGYTDAYSLSKWLASQKSKPDTLVSSPAVRAISTAFIFARTLQLKESEVTIEPAIYESSVETLYRLICHLPESSNSIALFGHNPGLTNLSNQLTEDMFFENVPTCGIVQIGFNVPEWKQVSNGNVLVYKYPKQFNV